MPKKIDPAVRERVMRMVADHRSEYSTPTELAKVIAARERIGRETVRRPAVAQPSLGSTVAHRGAGWSGVGAPELPAIQLRIWPDKASHSCSRFVVQGSGGPVGIAAVRPSTHSLVHTLPCTLASTWFENSKSACSP